MKKRKDFLKELEHITERKTKELRSLYKETKKEISESSEKEFLETFIGKYLVIEREKFSGYYGKIKSVEPKFSLCEDTVVVKYRLKVTYEKDGNSGSTYIDPVKKKSYKLFETEKEVINYRNKKK